MNEFYILITSYLILLSVVIKIQKKLNEKLNFYHNKIYFIFFIQKITIIFLNIFKNLSINF